MRIFLLLFFCCSIIGCNPSGRLPHSPDTLVVAMESSPTNLDPRIGIDKVSEDFHHLLFNGLLKKDKNDRMAPDLAAEVQRVSPVIYRFRLRDNVYFHNGKKLHAEDVVYTYNSILDGSVITTKRATLEGITLVQAISPLEVELLLKEPFSGLLNNLSIGIVPKDADDVSKKPIGTGPYRLLSFIADDAASMEAFDRYFDGRPRMRFLKLRVIPDATTRALELRKGSVDLAITGIPPDYFRILKQDPNLRVSIGPGNNYAYIGINLRDPILGNKKVRQALGYAVNREAMVKELFYGSAAPATGILPPHNWSYDESVLQISYDPVRAKSLLDEAGLRDPDGDGPAVRFNLTLKTSTNEFRRLVATAVQSDLEKVGIGIQVRSYEWGTFFSDINRGNFQLCLLVWVGISDPDIFRNVFASTGRWNRGKYEDPDVDRWVNLAKIAESEEEQKTYYSLVQRRVAEDMPYVSLWYEMNRYVMRKELAGLEVTPNADFRTLKDVYWMSNF